MRPNHSAWLVSSSGSFGAGVAEHLGEDDYLSVYVPTTPNPTSGYFILVRKSDTHELDMSVDDALKYIISMGVVTPGQKNR